MASATSGSSSAPTCASCRSSRRAAEVRVPLEWLREYVDVDRAPKALADELTLRGMETRVETSDVGWTDVVVGRVLAVERHPAADTLWLTRVDAGSGPLEIVCGAQNLEVGQLVPTALAGAVLPGGRHIERTKIRGVVSNGMRCRARPRDGRRRHPHPGARC